MKLLNKYKTNKTKKNKKQKKTKKKQQQQNIQLQIKTHQNHFITYKTYFISINTCNKLRDNKKKPQKNRLDLRLELTTSRISEDRFNHWTIDTDINCI